MGDTSTPAIEFKLPLKRASQGEEQRFIYHRNPYVCHRDLFCPSANAAIALSLTT
jgi:hypothetical protein